MLSFRLRNLFAVAIVVLINGCTDFGQSHETAQALSPEQIGLRAASDIAWPNEQWWRAFDDQQLSQLIDTALTGSPSIKIAQARLRFAQQAAVATRASNQPQLGLSASISREHFSENGIYPPPIGGSTVTQASTALDFSYEFDFWGRQRAELASALKQIDVERAEQASAQLVLAVAVAENYFSIQRLLAEQALLNQTLAHREHIVRLMQMRVQRGLASQAELETPNAALANTQREVAALDAAIASEKYRLAALCGIGVEQLPSIAAQTNENAVITPPHAALPADLLARRPDIIAQRLRVEAAGKDIVAAKAEFYPNIDLSGYFGLQSLGIGELFKSGSRDWGIGPALHLPLFNRDGLRAQLGARYANYDLAVEQYNQSILLAVRETADAGTQLQALAIQREALVRSVQAQQRLQMIADTRYRRGLGNQVESLAAAIDLLTQQRAAIDLQNEQLRAQLLLIKALGGGSNTAAMARDEMKTR